MRSVLHTDEHEAASAQVAGYRVGDGQGEADGYGCVDGVAAFLEDLEAGVGGVVLDGDDHGVFGGGWNVGRRCGLAAEQRRGGEQDRGGQDAAGCGMREHGHMPLETGFPLWGWICLEDSASERGRQRKRREWRRFRRAESRIPAAGGSGPWRRRWPGGGDVPSQSVRAPAAWRRSRRSRGKGRRPGRRGVGCGGWCGGGRARGC